jgi:fatty acid desaturase
MSGRHLALFILMHEGAHGVLLPSKRWNDHVSQWLTAYPVMADTFAYRREHFQHHKHTWTERDPDLALARALPVSKKSFRRKMIRDLTGQTAYARQRMLIRMICGLDPAGRGLQGQSLVVLAGRFIARQYGFVIWQALLLTAAGWSGHPEAYLLIWWLPALTGYSVVLRLRSIAEHSCVTDPNDPLRHTRTTLAPFWVTFFVAPHHVNYHLEHHLFMTVPHYHLPRAHRLLREAGALQHAEVAPSYRHVLRLAVGGARELATR